MSSIDTSRPLGAGARTRELGRVAIVHDYLTQRGGAERVVLSLARLFPDAPIFTSVYEPDETYPEFASLDVRTTPLQRLPHDTASFRRLLPLYPWAFGSIDLSGYDLVVSSTSGWAHGVHVPDGLHVAYCYNPPRWLYRRADYLANGSGLSRIGRAGVAPVLAALRSWDQRVARRPHRYIGISREVTGRIWDAYERPADLVHPPVDVDALTAVAPEPSGIGEPFHLVVARHLPYKRIDLAVQACERLGRRLVVVGGDGPASEQLRALAGPNVDFLCDLTDARLAGLLHDATAVIQPGEEDFGLGPLEANALGTPSIAYAAGGAFETVLDGETGVLFREQTVESLSAAIERVETRSFDPAALARHVDGFSERRFHDQLLSVIDRSGSSVPATHVA